MRKNPRLWGLAAVLVIAAALASTIGISSARAAATCQQTGFVRDGIDLTAAQIGGDVTTPLDATGCNIGVYYDATHTGSVTGADISGANYFGVLVNGASVNVTDSAVHDIGEVPLNGAQHGNAVVYLGGASGTIRNNIVSSYQKNGITVSGDGSSASVLVNVVTGEGPITYIAQNGIQISFGATAKVTGNTVTGNDYTPSKVTACGLLIYKAGGVSASKNGVSSLKADNNIHDNETDICNFGKGGGFDPTA
jgi:hypothetical protein